MQTNDTYEGRDLEAMAGLSRYYSWILETFRPFLRGYGVELGAGQGTMSREIWPYLDKLDLVEPSKNLYRLSRNYYIKANFLVYLMENTLCYKEIHLMSKFITKAEI